MRLSFQKYTYLPDFSRSSEGPAVKALFAIPFLLVQVWAITVGYLVAGFAQSTLAGCCAFAATTFLFQLKWTELGAHREVIAFCGLMLTGVVSALAVYLATQTNPAIYFLGWGVTGALSLRFYNWFWGPPMIFENRALGEVLTFISGPFYWVMVLVVAIIILGSSGLAHLIRGRQQN